MIHEIENMLSGNKDVLAQLISATNQNDTATLDMLTQMTLLNAQYGTALAMSGEKLEAMSTDAAVEFLVSMKEAVSGFSSDIAAIKQQLSA